MSNKDSSILPSPSPEHRRVVAGQFERANQVIAKGDFDYGIGLLLSCCKLDPANLIYRQTLRRIEKTKYQNNLRGKRLAWLTAWTTKAKIKAAKQGRDSLRVLELGEQVLARNPWDTGAQMDMAEAAEVLGLLDLAIWTLEQARQKNPQDAKVNRALARLYEKRGNFTQAIALWQMVSKVNPRDLEAQHKAKNLAASETIARGHYEDVINRQAAQASDGDAESGTEAASAGPRIPQAARKSPASALPGPHEPPAVPVTSTADRLARETTTLKARIEADPTNANAYLHLAGLLRRADRFEDARTVLQQGLGPTGNHFDISLELADLDIEPFRRDLAITDQRLKESPKDEELGKFQARLRKEINARELELHRQKAERYPTEMAHRYEVGVRLLELGQTDEAIQALQEARRDPRHHWQALYHLGICFKSRNNWRLARRNFEEALQDLPAGKEQQRKELLFLLATGCAEAGDLTAAIDLANDLANVDFAYRGIGRLLDEWTNRLQQADVSP